MAGVAGVRDDHPDGLQGPGHAVAVPAAAVIYALGRVNFLSDLSQTPHLPTEVQAELARRGLIPGILVPPGPVTLDPE